MLSSSKSHAQVLHAFSFVEGQVLVDILTVEVGGSFSIVVLEFLVDDSNTWPVVPLGAIQIAFARALLCSLQHVCK